MGQWDQDAAWHLLRRAGFGGSQARARALLAMGQQAAVASLLDFAHPPDPLWAQVNPLGYGAYASDLTAARATWLAQLLGSTRPLQARLTWFWHGVFASRADAVGAALMRQQLQGWHDHVAGNIGDFLQALLHDAAMQRFLDGDSNVARGPNENFARELLEQFTVGPGAFTEADVRDAARALTGWQVSGSAAWFDATRFDAGPKQVLGHAGPLDGPALMRLLGARAETCRHLCARLYGAFVAPPGREGDDAPDGLGQLEAAWQASGGDLVAVVRTLLGLSDFWDPGNRGALVKTGVDYACGLLLALQLPVDAALAYRLCQNLPAMGEDPFNPPDAAGYPGGADQTGAGALVARAKFAYTCIYASGGSALAARLLAGLPAAVAPAALVDQVLGCLGCRVVPATRSLLLGYAGATPLTGRRLSDAALGLAFLVACSPDYQIK